MDSVPFGLLSQSPPPAHASRYKLDHRDELLRDRLVMAGNVFMMMRD